MFCITKVCNYKSISIQQYKKKIQPSIKEFDPDTWRNRKGIIESYDTKEVNRSLNIVESQVAMDHILRQYNYYSPPSK